MLKPIAAHRSGFALTALLCAGLLLAACTRSANPTNLPSTTGTAAVSQGTPGGGLDGQNATMAAIGTEVAAQLTQTAVALSGAGGGGETDTVPTATLQPVAGETQTPSAEVLPSATAAVPPPGATPTVPPPAGVPCPNPYTVQQGDWLYKIARACGVAVNDLIAANPGINPNALKPGQLLNMPAAGATPSGGTTGGTGGGTATCTGTHTVVTGDTLYRLAYGCGLTIEQIAAANNIAYPYTIYPGQTLVYP